jgi:hypothetical protein
VETFTIKIMSLMMLLGIPGVFAWAADAPPQPMIAETWACSYRDGKSVDDVLKVRDFMVSQADKAGLILPPSFLWTLTEGDAHIDYVWFNVHLDSGVFDTSADTWEASGIGPAVLNRLSSVADCVAATSTAQMIFPLGNPGRSVPDGPVFIAAESCSYIDAASQKNLKDLLTHMHDVMKGMGDNAPAFSTALVPFTSGEPDVILYSGYENAAGWSSYVRELRNSEAGERLRNHKGRVLDCGGPTLWSSQQLVGVNQ